MHWHNMARPKFTTSGRLIGNTPIQWVIVALMLPAAILAIAALPLIGLMMLLDWTDDLRIKKFIKGK